MKLYSNLALVVIYALFSLLIVSIHQDALLSKICSYHLDSKPRLFRYTQKRTHKILYIMDQAHQSWYGANACTAETSAAFIDLRSMPARLSYCKSCSVQHSTFDNYSHYPVRLPKGDVYCYSCAKKLLDECSETAQSQSLKSRISWARESIDSQIEHCRKALEMAEQQWLLSQIPAARRLQDLRGDA